MPAENSNYCTEKYKIVVYNRITSVLNSLSETDSSLIPSLSNSHHTLQQNV